MPDLIGFIEGNAHFTKWVYPPSNITLFEYDGTQITTDDLVFFNGALRHKITEVTTTPYTVLSTDNHVSIQYTDTGTVAINLPALSSANHGQVYTLKDADYNAGTNNITITPNGSDTVDEGSSYVMDQDGQAITIIANNTTSNWEII